MVHHKLNFSFQKIITPTLVAFIALVILSGGVSVAIRISYTELPTFWGAAIRFGPAAIVLWAVVVVRRIPVPMGRALFVSLLFGVLSIGFGRSLMYWGLEQTPASLHQIIVSLTPLMTLFFATLHGYEKIVPRNLLSALLACAGITIAFGGMTPGNLSIIHVVSLLVAAACMAEGGVIMKAYVSTNPIVIAAISTTVGTVIIIVLSLLNKEPWLLPSSPQMWWVMAYLTIGASVIPLLLYLYILKRWPASAAIYPMVLMPFVTVLLATSLTDERVTWIFILGGLLVLIAVWFGAILVEPTHTSQKHLQTDI